MNTNDNCDSKLSYIICIDFSTKETEKSIRLPRFDPFNSCNKFKRIRMKNNLTQ